MNHIEQRLAEAQTEADFEAVARWLVDEEGFGQRAARELAAAEYSRRSGELASDAIDGEIEAA